MAPNAALANRFVGRLFSENGRLHFVLDVDTESGIARVSFRADGQQQIAHMTIAEVGLRLEATPALCLDGLESDSTAKRIAKRADGWFFTTREGQKGPYESESEANAALNQYIVAAQGGSVAEA